MATTPTQIKNTEIIEALTFLGLTPDQLSSLSTTGAQSTTFRTRVLKHLSTLVGKDQAATFFDRARTIAGFERTGDPAKDLTAILKTIGFTDDTARESLRRNNNDPATVAAELSRDHPSYSRLFGALVTPITGGDTRLLNAIRPGITPGIDGPVKPKVMGPPKPSAADLAGGRDTGNTFGPAKPTPSQLAAAKKNTPTGTSPSGSSPAPTPAPAPGQTDPTANPTATLSTPEQVRDYINKNFSQFAYLQDIPEIQELVKNAASGGWNDDRVLSALEQTPWWKKTESSARLWKEEKYRDPATALDKINSKVGELRNAATSAGITIPDDQLRIIAEQDIEFSWDDNERRAALGRFFNYSSDHLMGDALRTQQELRQKSADWLVPLDDATLQKWTTQVVNGQIDASYVDGYLAQQASSLFPQLAEPISRGIAPGQWMAPYRSVAAQTLSLNPADIDLRDSKWMRAVNQVGPDGSRTAMNLADWEDLLKSDPAYRWDHTDAGREHGARMASALAAKFGRNT